MILFLLFLSAFADPKTLASEDADPKTLISEDTMKNVPGNMDTDKLKEMMKDMDFKEMMKGTDLEKLLKRIESMNEEKMMKEMNIDVEEMIKGMDGLDGLIKKELKKPKQNAAIFCTKIKDVKKKQCRSLMMELMTDYETKIQGDEMDYCVKKVKSSQLKKGKKKFE